MATITDEATTFPILRLPLPKIPAILVSPNTLISLFSLAAMTGADHARTMKAEMTEKEWITCRKMVAE
jgi:hypothetical protein